MRMPRWPCRTRRRQRPVRSLQRGGFAEYIEHSNWNQYQPFVEVDLHPIEDLTITPGFKYVWWQHSVAAPIEQKVRPLSPYNDTFVTTQDLPFVEANYKIQPNWSVYFQYATGIYVPDISAFENKTGVLSANNVPKAQTTTNYQFGTVYYADNWTFDGDLYYIGINNNIVYSACTATGQFAGPSGETCAVNTGVATYKGIEGEGTYAFGDDDFGGWLNGMSVFASGSVNDAKSRGKYIKQAPLWTQATGIVYKTDGFKFSMIDKIVGQQYSDTHQHAVLQADHLQQHGLQGQLHPGQLRVHARHLQRAEPAQPAGGHDQRLQPRSAAPMSMISPTAAAAWISITMRRRPASSSRSRPTSRKDMPVKQIVVICGLLLGISATAQAGLLDPAAVDASRFLPPPPADGSADNKAEFAELKAIAARSTPAEVAAASHDGKDRKARSAQRRGGL